METPCITGMQLSSLEFVIEQTVLLCHSIWNFYGVQHHEIANIRTALFLRILIVDPESFREFLSLMNGPTVAWDIRYYVPDLFEMLLKVFARLLALNRLFGMSLDITSPDFVVENRSWKHSVVELFYYVFEPLWVDEKVRRRQFILLISD